MSNEFKMSRTKHTRTSSKFCRHAIKRDDPIHTSMRRQKYSDLYESEFRSKIPYKKIKRFLMSMVGKPVTLVFSEFTKKMKEYNRTINIKDMFDKFFDYDREKLKGFKNPSGFYVSEGIVNYKKIVRRRDNESPSHIIYNKTHINEEAIWNVDCKSGPIFIGKLWIVLKQGTMLLPVYLVSDLKYYASRNLDEVKLTSIYEFESLMSLKSFIKCGIVGYGYSIIPNNDYQDYSFITRISDVERYKKEKYNLI